jgi:hypothetical protein
MVSHKVDVSLTFVFPVHFLIQFVPCGNRAANLWAWNAPRADFAHAPYKPGREPGEQWRQIKATFRNSGNDPRFNDAELYYDEDGYFGQLGPQQEIRVNTYKTHVWNIVSKSTKEKLKTFTIDDDSSRELLFQV